MSGSGSAGQELGARLVDELHGMLQQEADIRDLVCRLTPLAAAQPAARIYMERIGVLAGEHSEALRNRLAALEGEVPPVCPVSKAPTAAEIPATRVLESVSAAAFGAVAGYATLLHLACRVRDSWIVATEGTTAHIARQHLQDYQIHLGRLPALLGELITWELDEQEKWCRCICAGCGMGFCMCGQNLVWREAWAAARTGMDADGVRIPKPRPASSAAQAGFREGDVILSANGVATDTGPALMIALKHEDPGTSLTFRVRRGERELDLRARRPISTDAPSLDSIECTTPSGQTFYFDRARDLQKQVRRGAKPLQPHPDGLAGLTTREVQVLRFVADGATNPMIADRLRISRPTVARHVQNILTKLGTANRAEAAALAAAQGFRSDS